MAVDYIVEVNRTDSIVEVEKFNPYHDARGRFTTAGGGGKFYATPGKSKAHDNAIAREKERKANAVGGRQSLSDEGKEAYDLEMENATQFEAYYALENGTTKESLAYQMYVHRSVTGNSLIADTRAEMDELKRALKDADMDGESYGLSKDTILGIKAAISEKINLHEKAIEAMEGARTEYEKYTSQYRAGNAKGKRNGGKWM